MKALFEIAWREVEAMLKELSSDLSRATEETLITETKDKEFKLELWSAKQVSDFEQVYITFVRWLRTQ